MTLTPEQAKEIKKQLFKQVESLPQENKEGVKKQILGLNEEQLEVFLKQNKIKISESGQLQQEGVGGEAGAESAGGEGQQCIFCLITKGQMPSHKIDENKKSIAILELNPLSSGHSIILPLEHIKTEKLPKSALTLAQKVVKKLKLKLKPEDIKIETSSFMDHAMINIIPIYKDGKLEKHKATEDELKKLQSKLETKKRGPRKGKKGSKPKDNEASKIVKNAEGDVIDSNLPQISFRIP